MKTKIERKNVKKKELHTRPQAQDAVHKMAKNLHQTHYRTATPET